MLELAREEMLPTLLPEEAARIAAEADEAAARLLAEGALTPNAVRSYRSALRYWDGWFRACTGNPLPLLCAPRQEVPAEVVRMFIAHHTPRANGERLSIGMPDVVRERMGMICAQRAIQTGQSVVGKRRVAKRAEADSDVPTFATIRHRIYALNSAHTYAGLSTPFQRDGTLPALLDSAKRIIEREASAALRLPKRPISRDLFERMLADCANDGVIGLRDRALLLASFDSGGRRRGELESMHWIDLRPIRHDDLPGYLWQVRTSKGRRRTRADRGVMEAALLGDAAIALDAWREAAKALGASLLGRTWLRLRESAASGLQLAGRMTDENIADVIKRRVAACGEDPDEYAGHSLRSGAATTALAEGVPLEAVAAALAHANLDTTRNYYDHREAPIDALAGWVKRR